VEGQPLQRNVPRLYFAVNKPKGYLCASSAEPGAVGGKKLVIDLFAVRILCQQAARACQHALRTAAAALEQTDSPYNMHGVVYDILITWMWWPLCLPGLGGRGVRG